MNTHDIDIELPAEFRSGNSVPVTVATIKRERMEEILRDAINPEVTEFELVQDGIPVAGSYGPREEAWREIQRYAAQYSEDGPVEIYEVIRRRVEEESIQIGMQS